MASVHAAVEIELATERVEVLQEAYTERRLAETARPTYYARKCMCEFQIVTHGKRTSLLKPLEMNMIEGTVPIIAETDIYYCPVLGASKRKSSTDCPLVP